MIAIVDYGVGNLFSLKSSLDAIGAPNIVTGKKEEIEKASKIILPGVGAFKDAIQKLRETHLDEILKQQAENNKDILGICLGMQLLFEKSYEYGEHDGLGLLKGEIRPIKDNPDFDLKIPHIGWNALNIKKPECKIMKYVNENDYVYFVHSYYAADCDDSVVATSEYGRNITAVVAKDNVYGCQFHPEKSGKVGLGILSAFCE